jgi:hypothetical protein
MENFPQAINQHTEDGIADCWLVVSSVCRPPRGDGVLADHSGGVQYRRLLLILNWNYPLSYHVSRFRGL